jgi:hypothetical protein
MKDDTLGLYNTADLRAAARRRLPIGCPSVADLNPGYVVTPPA